LLPYRPLCHASAPTSITARLYLLYYLSVSSYATTNHLIRLYPYIILWYCVDALYAISYDTHYIAFLWWRYLLSPLYAAHIVNGHAPEW
jgi:hypothetical protein